METILNFLSALVVLYALYLTIFSVDLCIKKYKMKRVRDLAVVVITALISCLPGLILCIPGLEMVTLLLSIIFLGLVYLKGKKEATEYVVYLCVVIVIATLKVLL